ncbi:MAG: DUF4450 domain-containing protein [Sedimentisphaerales bacterium]|nr:DUF4450 domain-containing protein [Sedimentisphaerales bacterium]
MHTSSVGNQLPILQAALALFATTGAFGGQPYNPPERIRVVRPTVEGAPARPLRYRPDGKDFVIENSREFFNRPLYAYDSPPVGEEGQRESSGRSRGFRVDAGDMPEFSLYLPGRGGNLRLGLRTSEGAKWLFDAQQVIARYRPGSMLYEIRDPLLGDAALRVTAITMYTTDGLLVRVECNGAGPQAELIFAYGGMNGDRGARSGDIGCEREPVSRFFQLRPMYCRDNTISAEANTFTLRGKPGTVRGVLPSDAQVSVGDATQWASPAALLASAGQPGDTPVVVGHVALDQDQPLHLALQLVPGRGRDVPLEAEQLSSLFELTEQYRAALASRVAVETPDPFIDAAVAALCVAADGIWDEPQGAVMHGAVAWRSTLLGWRGPYSCDALGWHDRAERHLAYWARRQNTRPVPDAILPADPTANLSRNEPSLHSNGDMSGRHYDMNLVYIDMLLRHVLWTGDLDLATELWPVIERHLAWERRLFRRPFGSDGLPLYEAYAAIWASDDLQYHGGGVTHASAYNHYHNRMVARLAKLIGKDPGPFEQEAELILKAMRRELWLPEHGWFGEWKDPLGLQQVHPAAALWTFYHTIDSEVPTPFEAWQMTRFVDTQIAHIPVADGCFTLPTTNWMPYTWSTNNVVMAEVAHTSLAYWKAGRADEAFRAFKGCIFDSMYQGLCPGNLGMTTYFDAARGEAQRDFGDAVGIVSRAVVEGLFGIHPDVLSGQLTVQPGLPADWDHASIHHPDFSLKFRRDGLTETYVIEPNFARPLSLRLVVPALRDSVAGATLNGAPVEWQAVGDSVGTPRIAIQAPAAAKFEIAIAWTGESAVRTDPGRVVARGSEVEVDLGAATPRFIFDPQRVLPQVTLEPRRFRATARGTLGHRTAFLQVQQGQMSWWLPVSFEVRPAYEIIPSPAQDAEHLRFRVRDNTVQTPALSEETVLPAEGFLPGSNRVVADLGEGRRVEGVVTNWKIETPGGGSRWDPLVLDSIFNDKVTQIFKNEYLSPRSPYCSLAIPRQGIGSWCNFAKTVEIDDSGLRTAAGRNDGLFVLPQGVPFRSPGVGGAKNTVFTSQWDNYPNDVTIPLEGKARSVYLLMAGSTNSMQSQFDNGEVIVTYTDGATERLALRNPTTWWPIDQDYFIDDYAFSRPEPIPPRVDLKTGTVRVLDVDTFKGKGREVPGGAATVLNLPLDDAKELESLTVRTLANEVVIGLMGATLAR